MDLVQPPPGIEILDKANALIKALVIGGELTVKELAKRVGEPVSSTYRLVSNMTQLGWVATGSKRGLYRLGLVFMRIGAKVEATFDLREQALPYLRHLMTETGDTARLIVRRDLRGVGIDRAEGRDVRLLTVGVGDSLPLVFGGAPRVLLAFLPQLEYERIIDRCLAVAAVEIAPHSRREADATTEEIRRTGIAMIDSDVTPGVASVAAPVFDHRDEVVGALAVSGLRERIVGEKRRKKVVGSLRRSAQDLSIRLGWPGAQQS